MPLATRRDRKEGSEFVLAVTDPPLFACGRFLLPYTDPFFPSAARKLSLFPPTTIHAISPKSQVPRKFPVTAPRPKVPTVAPNTQLPWSARHRPRTSKPRAPDAQCPCAKSLASTGRSGRRTCAPASQRTCCLGCALSKVPTSTPLPSSWAPAASTPIPGATRDRPLDRNFGARGAAWTWASPSAFPTGIQMCTSPHFPALGCPGLPTSPIYIADLHRSGFVARGNIRSVRRTLSGNLLLDRLPPPKPMPPQPRRASRPPQRRPEGTDFVRRKTDFIALVSARHQPAPDDATPAPETEPPVSCKSAGAASPVFTQAATAEPLVLGRAAASRGPDTTPTAVRTPAPVQPNSAAPPSGGEARLREGSCGRAAQLRRGGSSPVARPREGGDAGASSVPGKVAAAGSPVPAKAAAGHPPFHAKAAAESPAPAKPAAAQEPAVTRPNPAVPPSG